VQAFLSPPPGATRSCRITTISNTSFGPPAFPPRSHRTCPMRPISVGQLEVLRHICPPGSQGRPDWENALLAGARSIQAFHTPSPARIHRDAVAMPDVGVRCVPPRAYSSSFRFVDIVFFLSPRSAPRLCPLVRKGFSCGSNEKYQHPRVAGRSGSDGLTGHFKPGPQDLAV